MKLIIDRFEGEYAICETEEGEFININRNQLPDETKEGDVVFFDGVMFVIDNNTKKEREERIQKMIDDLWD